MHLWDGDFTPWPQIVGPSSLGIISPWNLSWLVTAFRNIICQKDAMPVSGLVIKGHGTFALLTETFGFGSLN